MKDVVGRETTRLEALVKEQSRAIMRTHHVTEVLLHECWGNGLAITSYLTVFIDHHSP